MKNSIRLLLGTITAGLGVSAGAATYSGNGSTDWGGPVGTGSLNLTDDGTTLNLTFNKPNGDLGNNALVLYIDSVTGGFVDTSTFADTGDGGRMAISGFDGTDRSTLTFATGFRPDYAVAIEGTYASLFQLTSGGANSLNWLTGATQPGSGSATFNLSIPLSSLGLSAGQSFELFGSLISTSGYRSSEGMGGNLTGSDGWNPFTQATFSTYTTTVVPEPASLALFGLGALALGRMARRKA